MSYLVLYRVALSIFYVSTSKVNGIIYLIWFFVSTVYGVVLKYTITTQLILVKHLFRFHHKCLLLVK